MATRTSLEASITKLRSVFTSAERKLLDSSSGKKLAAASERQVKELLKQCRTLRDKWRDLVGSQARTVKRGSKRAVGSRVIATTPTNDRSHQKHSIFSDVVAHIETHLAGLTGESTVKRSTAAKPTANNPAAKKASAAGVTAKKTSAAKATGSSGNAATAAKARSISRKARQAGAMKALEASSASGLRTTTAKQRKATAALKAERLKLKGVTTRRAGHAKVQGGRSQARRDGRNAQR